MRGGDVLLATPLKVVDVTDPASEAEVIAWWEELTSKGGEGMVVKPLDFVAKGKRGLVQPAMKCRGRDYLRIIWSGVHAEGESRPSAPARIIGEALAGAARVRAGGRGARAVRAGRTAAAGTRVRLWRLGAGKRAR